MRVAYAHFRQHLLVLWNYRVNMFVWNLLGILKILVYLSVWSAVADAHGGSVNGYAASTFAGYYIVMLTIQTIISPSIGWKLPMEVRQGDFDVRLLRPYHPAMAIHTSEFGATLISLTNILLLGVPLAFLFDADFGGSTSSMLAACAVLPIAVVNRYLIASLIATLAFRFTRIDGARSIMIICITFLGGEFVPLEVTPDWFSAIAHLLPFYWTLGFPVELFIGRVELSDAFSGALVMAFWAMVMFLTFRIAWRRGLRRLETVGS